MLERVVEEDDFCPVRTAEQLASAIHTVLVHSNQYLWKLSEIQQWFVTQVFAGAYAFSQFEAFGLSAVATTQGRDVIFVLQ